MVGVARLGEFCETARVGAGADRVISPWVARGVSPPPSVVAVSVGPGAFTGIRVGLAHALGVGLALGIDVVPLSSLAVRALLMPGTPCLTVVLDAKKDRVYVGRFDTRGAVPVALGPEEDVEPAALVGGGPVVGEGALVHRVLLEAKGFVVAEGAGGLPLERVAALVASVPPVDPARVAPRYLREPDARRLG